MLRRKWLKKVCFLLCVFAAFSVFSLEAFARDDNPDGNVVAEFPTALEIESGNCIMTNNYGTISAAKSRGEILYNFGTISSLEGAIVQENCKDAIIDEALNGTINVNKGSIELINCTAVIKLNAVDGVINQNLNTIEQNMGTVKENYSIIDENRGTIEKVGEGGTVLQHIEGSIGENLGTVTVVPDSQGIITVAVIENNSGTVYVEADLDNKSTVQIVNNTNKLVIKNGADCIVENNSGTVEIEEGGKCILKGTNTGEMPQTGVVYLEGDYYKLILDNITRADIQMISNYETVGDDIYVSKDTNFSFAIDDSKYSVMWSDDSNIHSASVEFIRLFNEDSKKYVDDSLKTVLLHIHTLGSSSPSTVFTGHHEILCTACGELAKVEACSGGTATCMECAKCAKCGQEYGSISTEHSFGEWKSDGSKHWKECIICGIKANEEACIGGAATCKDRAKCATCGQEYGSVSTEHSYGKWKSDGSKHWKECSVCGIKANEEACSGGTATCKNRAKCAKCGQKYGSVSTEHSFDEWIIQKEPEIGVEGIKSRKCSVCGFSETDTIPAKPEPEEPKESETLPTDNHDDSNNTGTASDNNSESEQGNEIDNGGSEGNEEINNNEPTAENTENDVNTGLQEETNNSSNEVNNEVNTADTPSLEEPDSAKKGVMWPIAAVGACVVVAVVVAVSRKK